MSEAAGLVQAAIAGAQLLISIGDRRRERAAETLQDVLDRTGLTLEQLEALVEAQVEVEDLVVRGLQGALDAVQQEKRQALTMALVRSVQLDLATGTEIETARFLMNTLVRLDAAHLAVLDVIAGPEPREGTSSDELREWRRVLVREILNAMPGLDPVIRQVMGLLEQEGLIEREAPGSGYISGSASDPVFWITTYGLALLEFVSDESPATPG